MKIKKYNAESMQQAMNLIRQDLGPNAVIISSEKARRKSIRDFFGPQELIVTAAVEEDKPQHSFLEQPKNGDHPQLTEPNNNVKPKVYKSLPAASSVYRTQPGKNPGGGLDITRSNSSEGPLIPRNVMPARLPAPLLSGSDQNKDAWFKVLLDDIVNQQEGTEMESDAAGKWKKILRNLEVEDKISDIILSGISETDYAKDADAEDFLLVSLKNNIVKLVENAYKRTESNRIITFVGPTGVGKTTTLVKIATRYQVFHQKSIAFIALYSHRFGALEELNYYAEMIGAPIEVVMTPGELQKAVQKHADKDYIFIDTGGRPSKNTGQILELKSFIDAVEEDQDVLLVLSATTKNRDIIRIAKDFSRVGIHKLVFTKLDETDTLGAMLNVICETGAPVSYVTKGQNIPDDIEAINPKLLANIILDGFDHSERVDI